MNLADQVVLITGAGRGLGHGVARGLARYGALVVAVSRTETELEELEETVRKDGGQIETYSVDLSEKSEIADLVQWLHNRHGPLDAIINNAAVLQTKSFLNLTSDEFDRTLDVNLRAPIQLIRSFLPSMIEAGRGSIINVSSAAGVRGFVDETDYCASKFGLEGFSYSLALELQPSNVSVNLVTPGYRIKPTSVTAEGFAAWPAERRAEYRDPIDMADAFAFLTLQDGNGITGQRFNAYELAQKVRQEGWGWNRKMSSHQQSEEGIEA